MELRSIDHVTLYVNSIDNVKQFYQDIFNLSCKEVTSDGTSYLIIENDTVHFFIMEDPDVTPVFVAKQHLSFEVERLESVIEKLEVHQLAYETGYYDGFKARNYRWCEWLDPESIRVECVQYV